ncbi:MAG: ABC transporter permease [Chloroflexi bacterium]|nr:ABC transporter permease [Chloroflexota bacterium]
MAYVSYARQLIVRNPRRTFTHLFGLVLAVGLFAGILFFVDASSQRMTQSAVQSIQVDMQVYSTLATPSLDPIVAQLLKTRGVTAAQPILSTDYSASATSNGDKTTSSGKLFVVSPAYFDSLKTLRLAAGSFDPNGALVSQPLFGALGLNLGDTIAVDFPQVAQPIRLRVTGIVDTSQAMYLFAATDPAHAGEFNPVPDDIFIAPTLWESTFAEALTHPTLTANGKPIAPQPIQGEVDTRIDHSQLPSDPLQASNSVDVMRRHLEAQFPGEVRVTNNLGDALTTTQSDALWAKLLFLFLGMPGVALAAYLSKYATDLITGPQRQEISLLRARGATPRQILIASGLASAFIAAVGTLVGLVLGLATTLYLFGPTLWQQIDAGSFLLSALVTFLAGLALTMVATYLPIRHTLHEEIAQEHLELTRAEKRPFWARAYLDFVSLAIAALLFSVNAQSGGFDTAGSEGQTLTLGFLIFFAPLFLWIGATLLLSRVMGGGIQRAGAAIRAVLRRAFGDLGDMAGREIVRRSNEIGAAIVIVALAISFGTSLAIFTRTYQAQKAVDARYELGADIQITPAISANPTAALGKTIAAVRDVGAITPLKTSQATVGSTAQPVYGIDAGTFAQAAFFPDSYVRNMTAAQALAKMAATPNGVLVSAQLADAYSVQVGDPILFRVLDKRTNQNVQIKGQVLGVVTRFPTSQSDTLLVVNLSFLTQAMHDDTVTLFLAGAAGPPAAAARHIRDAFTNIPMRVQDIDTATIAAGRSLTSLNINGLGAIEGLYTLIIASIGLGIFLMAMVYQRAKEFGTMRALGASAAQVSRFLWAESLTVGLLALAIGGVIGFGLSKVFVLMLGALFTVPPADVTIPWGSLFTLFAATLAGMIACTLWVNHRLNGMEVDQVLREL